MGYLKHLFATSSEGILTYVEDSLKAGIVSRKQIEGACLAEIEAELVKDQFYQLSSPSKALLNALSTGPDATMVPVIRKILKSTKLASHTFRDPQDIPYVDQPLIPEEK